MEAVWGEVGEVREDAEGREAEELEVEALVRRELEAVEGSEEDDPGVVPAPIGGAGGEAQQVGPVGLQVCQELRPGLGLARGDAGTEGPGEELAGDWPVEGRLDDGGVWGRHHGYQNVRHLNQDVESSPEVLPELRPVGGGGAGDLTQVGTAGGHQDQLRVPVISSHYV